MITIQTRKSERLNQQESAFVSFKYDAHLVTVLRGMPVRFYNPTSKEWEIPVSDIELLKSEVGTLNVAASTPAPIEPTKEDVELPDLIPADYTFKTTPYDYQRYGINYGLNKKKFILADEQGLGKTLQVINIASILSHKNGGVKKCLVVCGVNTLKSNWKREIEAHSSLSAHILGTRYKKGKMKIGTSQDKLEDLYSLPDSYFLVTNIESLRYKVCVGEAFHKRKNKMEKVYDYPIRNQLQDLIARGIIEMVAFDEFHKCKNPLSEQGKAILELKPEYRIAMTGTPLMNSPLDLFMPLHWIDAELHNFYQFRNHYCVLGGFGGQTVVNYKNLNQLQQHLQQHQLRRLKKEVLELPEKIYKNEYLEMDAKQEKIYDEVRNAILEDIDKISKAVDPLSQLIRLRQATGYTGVLSTTVQESIKYTRALEILEDAVESGEKVVIFSNWTAVANPLYEILKKKGFNPAIITGEVKDELRKAQEEKLANDPTCKVMIGTTGAMGTGLTLTAANHVIFLDEPWNRANKEQAEDRCHRIGTKSNVNIYTLICEGTIDEAINNIVYKKGQMADLLVDGKFNRNRTGDLLLYLLGVAGK